MNGGILMIKTDTRKRIHILEQAQKKAVKQNIPQFVSYTEKLNAADPVNFFQQGDIYKGDRFYWTSADDMLTLVGVGSVKVFVGEDDAFVSVEQQWNALLKGASIDNPYEVPGTGPIMMGGFAFDPRANKDPEIWRDFPNSKLVVPKFLLTHSNKDVYLTVNQMVKPEDNFLDMLAELKLRKGILLTGHYSHIKIPELIEKREIGTEFWKETVKFATEQIDATEIDKVVLAREMQLEFEKPLPVSSVLNYLTNAQPNSYTFCFENGLNCFIGATPERLVKLENRQLLSTCLAGTAPRGKTKEEDNRYGVELLNDNKNLEEHAFVVDMIKSAIEGCCSDVVIPEEPTLYPLRQLQHLYTPVRGQLKEGFSLLEVVKRLHPTPALGGYPIEESLAFIRKHEQLERGWYAAPIGWMDNNGNGEFAVAIRSALLQGNKASLFSGCGVVRDSNPEAEYQETAIKFLPMLTALGGAS